MRRSIPALLGMAAVLAATLAFGRPASSGALPVARPVGTYQNPVIASDFPDPFILADNGNYFAYATNANGPNIQVLSSTDLKTWVLYRDALPALPSWAVAGKTWAPSVLKVDSLNYVLYYSARNRATGTNCIGRAHGRTPIGPFTDDAPAPLVCQGGVQHGSIDPSPFVDWQMRPWLLWKSEGLAGVEPTRIWSQPMTLDGLGFDGPPSELLHTDQAWEGPIIENPSMTWNGGKLLLFYSGGQWQNNSYGINWAHCAGMRGPCTKSQGPWVKSVGPVIGPGGQDFFHTTDGKLWMSYHAWSAGAVGYPHGMRSLRIDRVGVSKTHDPILYGPSTSPAAF
jgi:beta-xylosidase